MQGEIEFDGGSQRRYSLGGSVLKLVTYTTPLVRKSIPTIHAWRDLSRAAAANDGPATEPTSPSTPPAQ